MRDNFKTLLFLGLILAFSVAVNTDNSISQLILEKTQYLNIDEYEQTAIAVGMDLDFLSSDYCLPLKEPTVTSPYGNRIHPITGEDDFHSGLDIYSDCDEVYAIDDATLLEQGYDEYYGYYVILQHFDDTKSLYAHLSNYTSQYYYNKGDILGYMGDTGQATGKHLHIEIWQNDQSLDPALELKIYEN